MIQPILKITMLHVKDGCRQNHVFILLGRYAHKHTHILDYFCIISLFCFHFLFILILCGPLHLHWCFVHNVHERAASVVIILGGGTGVKKTLSVPCAGPEYSKLPFWGNNLMTTLKQSILYQIHKWFRCGSFMNSIHGFWKESTWQCG